MDASRPLPILPLRDRNVLLQVKTVDRVDPRGSFAAAIFCLLQPIIFYILRIKSVPPDQVSLIFLAITPAAKMGLLGARVTENLNGRLTFVTTVLMLSQINFGIDLVVFSNTQAMTPFERRFGRYDPKHERYAIEPYFSSLLNSLTYAGQVFGVLTGGWVVRHYGRRVSFWVMSYWAIVAAILLVTAQQKEKVLVGRIVNYIYLGQELVTVPISQAEICPPKVRGMLVGTFQLGTMIGAFIGACITYGTSKIDGEASFRIPFGIFFVIPFIVATGAYFMVESPRWLLVRGRNEEALESLRRYRAGKFTEEQIMEDFRDQVASIRLVTHERGTLKEMFQGTNLRRSLIVIGANISIQISGQGLVSKNGTIFIKDLNGPDPFQMYLINTSLQIVFVLLALNLFDRIGRKPLLVIGSLLQTVSYFAIGGLDTDSNSNRNAKIATTALFTLYYVGFVIGWAPIYHIITSEIPNSRMRDITYTVASSVTVVTQFVVSFCIPYLLYAPYANLGSKVGFVFAPLALPTLIFAVLAVPECRGFSLEEIDHLFMQRMPLRKFQTYEHGAVLPQEISEQGTGKMGDEGAYVEEREVATPEGV